MRNMAADRVDLPQHRVFIGSFDCGQIARCAERVNDTHRRWQANLEAHVARDVAAGARGEEILIGRPRLPRITELAKSQVVRGHIVCKTEQRKTRRLAHSAAWIGTEEGARAHNGTPATGPDPAWSRRALRE